MASTDDPAKPDISGDLPALLEDFRRHLKASRKSDGTVDLYARHIGYLLRWLADTGRPTSASSVTKAHLEGYFIGLGERRTRRNGKVGEQVKPTYVATQYRSVQQFWTWLVVEEEITENPFAKMKPPHAPDPEIPVMPHDAAVTLLKACDGKDFNNVRDKAIIRLFLDTGLRVSGLANIDEDDLDHDTIHAVLKDGKELTLPFGAKTSDALRRYRRARAKHPQSKLTKGFWLGDKGKLSAGGVQQMLERRARDAGIDAKSNPHAFRHLFAHEWLLNKGNEHDLARLMGWTSTKMAGRYAASAALERAHVAHRRQAPGDQY
jgi:site-specific recombinase XerD